MQPTGKNNGKDNGKNHGHRKGQEFKGTPPDMDIERAEANATQGCEGCPESPKEAMEALAEMEQRYKDLERERDEYLDMAQRIKAEFDNFRRRNSAVRTEAWEDGARETIALMLPVIDNLERALSAEKEKTPMRDGVELTLKQMLSLLEKRGVAAIDRVGEPFDPELENAVAQADPSEGEPGTVCDVLLKGYKTANRVIRHAMVRVVAQ